MPKSQEETKEENNKEESLQCPSKAVDNPGDSIFVPDIALNVLSKTERRAKEEADRRAIDEPDTIITIALIILLIGAAIIFRNII